VLHFFSGPPADGWNPAALIQGSDGNFYGMTVQGGDQSFGWGTAFKLTPEGVETILHSFTAQSDGAYPSVGLVQGSDGNFYGTAGGGMNDGATIFRLTPTAG